MKIMNYGIKDMRERNKIFPNREGPKQRNTSEQILCIFLCKSIVF